jgi:hypothetical protein
MRVVEHGNLEEVHGGAFGSRVPIRESMTTNGDEPIAKLKVPSESVQKRVSTLTLPLDTDASTVTFVAQEQKPVVERMKIRERFVDPQPMSHADAAAEEKLTRILRLIEQNKTGYEKPAIQDMVLYIFTGVFFLFTFDTFVQLGKGMRPGKKSRKD